MAGTITVGELLSDPTSGNKITIGSGTTLDLKSGAGDVVMPSGSVVATYTDSLTAPVVFNSATYADSGLSITLTPESTSSKFIINIFGHCYLESDTENAAQDYIIYRDSTSIQSGQWTNYLNRAHYANDFYPPFNVTCVDIPNTTSAITYNFKGRKYGGVAAPWTFGDSNGGTYAGCLTITEVQG